MPKIVNREELYKFLWENTDRHGFIQKSQQDISKEYDVSWQRLSELFLEYQAHGRMKKFANRFQIKDPDSFSWDNYQEETKKFRSDRGR